MSVQVIHGDCREVMRGMDAESVDAVVTDPPYHLTSGKKGGTGVASLNPNSPAGRSRIGTGFMGKAWDGGDTAFDPAMWAEALRVLKPGGHLVAFGAPRNVHRLTCAIEDAGFEIRDSLMWLFGTGFPKSHDVSKKLGADWAGWGTALKPAYEPIILARKPLDGTVAANVLEHGVGALNIDACRVPTDENLNGGAYAGSGGRSALSGDERKGAAAGMFQAGKTAERGYEQPPGRWPANVVHDGSPEVVDAFPDTTSKRASPEIAREGWDRNDGHSGQVGLDERHATDSGTAARFFYSAKATKADRAGSKHPTVKPIALMQWLCRMVTPPGGTILDPFAGTGTTGAAAEAEGFNAILIEREDEYVADIRRRFDAPAQSRLIRR